MWGCYWDTVGECAHVPVQPVHAHQLLPAKSAISLVEVLTHFGYNAAQITTLAVVIAVTHTDASASHPNPGVLAWIHMVLSEFGPYPPKDNQLPDDNLGSTEEIDSCLAKEAQALASTGYYVALG